MSDFLAGSFVTCWYCSYGWPVEVADIYERYASEYGSVMHYGPSHIVWEDENFDDDSVRCCIKWCDAREFCSDLTDDEIAAVRRSLEEMLLLPESVRHPAMIYGDNPPPPELKLRSPRKNT